MHMYLMQYPEGMYTLKCYYTPTQPPANGFTRECAYILYTTTTIRLIRLTSAYFDGISAFSTP